MNMVKQDDGPQLEEVSIAIEDAAKWLMKNILPFSLISLLPFFIINGLSVFKGVSFIGVLGFLALLLIGVAVHELLHALVFGLFSKGGFKSVSFGIEPVTNSPWCHYDGEMSVMVYRVGALTPFFIMGLFPMIYAYVANSPGWLIFGYLYSLGGGGDWVAVFLTRGLGWFDIIRDHPSKLGFFVVRRQSK